MLVLLNVILVLGIVILLLKNFELQDQIEGKNLHDYVYLEALSEYIDSAEGYASGHAKIIAEEALYIAEKLALPETTLNSLKIAALLHDCGELTFNRQFLKTNASLSVEERDLIATHPLLGEHTIRKHVSTLDEVPSIIRWHHERWDGTGYPDRLKGEEIPITARILAVADAISAMSNDRPYRPALSKNEIIHELHRLAGFQFDPEIVAIAIKRLESTKN